MYLVSVLAVILCFIFIQFLGPIKLFEFMDVTSIAFLILLVVPIMLSAGLLKDLNNAFRLVFGKKREAAMLELKRAKLAVDTMIKVSLYSSIFVTMLELVVILHTMAEPAALGPMISIALLIILYAMMLSLLLLPVRAKLEQRILEYMPSYEEKDEVIQEETVEKSRSRENREEAIEKNRDRGRNDVQTEKSRSTGNNGQATQENRAEETVS